MNSRDQARIADAIKSAESRTSAQIVCVVAKASSSYTLFALLWASLTAFAAPWPLIYSEAFGAGEIYLVQIGLFCTLFALFSTPPLRYALVPLKVRRARAHRAALEQYTLRGIATTHSRRGVLIFISKAERWARIMVDEGIAEKIPAHHWQSAIDALLQGARRQQMTDGFIDAIAICAAELERQFPPQPDDQNELPNRIYIL